MIARRLLFARQRRKPEMTDRIAVSAANLGRQLGTASQGQMSAFEASLLLVQNAASGTLGSQRSSDTNCQADVWI